LNLGGLYKVLILALALCFQQGALGVASTVCRDTEVAIADYLNEYNLVSVDGSGSVPDAIKATPGRPATQLAFPPAHTKERAELVRASQEILKQRSDALIHFFETENPYQDTRFRKVVIKGIGPHAAAFEFGMSRVLGNFVSIFGFNKGPVVSHGVFGHANPFETHATAEGSTLGQHPDNVSNVRGNQTQRDFAGLPLGAYPPSSIVGDQVTISLARSQMDLMMNADVVRSVPAKYVAELRKLIDKGAKGLSKEQIALAKENSAEHGTVWPSGARYMHFVDVTLPDGRVVTQKFFSDYLVVGTGLGPPKNPFSEGHPAHDIIKNEWARLRAKQSAHTFPNAPLRPGVDYVSPQLIHEASSIFQEPNAVIKEFAAAGEVVAYGGGYSNVVALNRFFENEPNPKKPYKMLTRSALHEENDAITLQYIQWANSDLFVMNAKNVSEPVDIGGGKVRVTFTATDKAGYAHQYSVDVPKDRYRAPTPQRNMWGKVIPDTFIVSVVSEKPRLEHIIIKADSLRLEPQGNRLVMTYEDAAGGKRTSIGRFFGGVGQDAANSHNTMWGPEFSAQEEFVKGDVHHGFKPGEPARNVNVAMRTKGLVAKVQTESGVETITMELEGAVDHIGPAANRSKRPLYTRELMQEMEAPNTSQNSLSLLMPGSVHDGSEYGRMIAAEMKARPEVGKPITPDIRLPSIGKILPEYSRESRPTTHELPPVTSPEFAHLRNLAAPDAPSVKMLHDALFGAAGESFAGLRAEPNNSPLENRVHLYFFRDKDSGEFYVVINRLAGGEAAKAKILETIKSRPKFLAHVDAWMRANNSPLAMWLPFDAAGNFLPGAVRINTPIEAMVAAFREGKSTESILAMVPRPVDMTAEADLRGVVAAHIRNLYEIPGNRRVEVSAPVTNEKAKKRFFIVHTQGPNADPKAPLTKQLAVVEYGHADQALGIQAMAGAQAMMERGLYAMVANIPERAAQAFVKSKSVQDPEYRLYIVYHIRNDGGTLDLNPASARDPLVLAQTAQKLATMHATPNESADFSKAANVWIKKETDRLLRTSRPGRDGETLKIIDLLSATRWKGMTAHGDLQLAHVIHGEQGVGFAGFSRVVENHHPLEDVQTLLYDLKANLPPKGGTDPRDTVINSYIEASGARGEQRQTLRKLLNSWKN